MPSLYRSLAFSAIVVSQFLFSPVTVAEEGDAVYLAEGKSLAFTRKQGNCLACHQIEGGTANGNIGPPLTQMKIRFPDKAKLRAQIANATIANPLSRMPPFEKHGILTSAEVDKVTAFIHSLK